MISLLDFPLELFDQIISILAKERPPSARLLKEEPSDSLLRSDYHPLKDLSQTCGAMRELCFPSLFSAVKVDLSRTSGFLSFSESHSLSSHIKSLMLYRDPNDQAEDIGVHNSTNIWLPMVRIVDSVKSPVVTVVLTTFMFEKILPYKLNFTDVWAFNIPYQILQLQMSPDLAASSQTSPQTIQSPDVFAMRNWTHCTFNEGSSINCYSRYEYFAQRAPSIFNPLVHHYFVRATRGGSFEYLKSFDYIAVFPINHIQELCLLLNRMKNLKCLRVQLAPTPDNNVLDDPAALGKCQPKDVWQEFEACYASLADNILESWFTATHFIEEFVSSDYVNPSLREILDRVVGQKLIPWASDANDGRWIRKEELSEEPNQ